MSEPNDTKGYGKVRLFATSAFFGVAVVMLLLLSFYAWRTGLALTEVRSEYSRYDDARTELNRLQSLVLQVESNQRGYLITEADSFLESYRREREKRKAATRELRSKFGDDEMLSARFTTLSDLVNSRELELERAVEKRKDSSSDDARKALLEEERPQLLLHIQQEFMDLGKEISVLRENAELVYRSKVDRLLVMMRLSAIVSLISGVAGLAFLLGHVKAQERAIDLEEEKRLAEKSDREKTKFLASMNHEIRTPLNAMLGFSELLTREVDTERGKRFLKAIRTSGESLAELINDILDLSKIQSGSLDLDPEPLSTKEFFDGVKIMFEEQASEKGLGFRCEVMESTPDCLMLDGLRLRQILVNLIGNALKFTDEGTITLLVESNLDESDDREHCELKVHVRDTGRGISPEKKELIFQPFKQASSLDEEKGGTGLGLSICRELVLLMEGDLTVESEPGKGATFSIVLPDVEIIESVSEVRDRQSEDNDFNELPPSRVLVVDDNPYNRELIGSFLEDAHHEVFYAENGMEALSQMRSILPDIVLMDIRMPVMTGDEARQKMLEDDQLAGIPVIAVTASSLMAQERRLRRLFDGYLRKPFSGERLLSGMRQTLQRGKKNQKPGENELEPVGTSAVVESSPAYEIEDRKGLLKSLTDIRDKRWEELTGAMVFSEVFAVASEIEEVGKAHGATVVEEYAENMREYARNFDQAKLEQLLSRVDQLFEEIGNGNAGEDT
ncbi:MAG: ATP-binding protein [Verrucomicrobiales bacterium]|nr:ATP-binding protein [Verrucomicrobiales bacterium]